MKRYEIPSASKLKEAIVLMRNSTEVPKATAVAKVWSIEERKGSGKHFRVYVELGRKAQLFRKVGSESLFLGDMHLTRTREFVKGLKETNESS